MKSPFPGMDPYLEDYWRDVHSRFLTYLCDELQEHLPTTLRARLEERVCVAPDDRDLNSIYPDIRIIDYREKYDPRVAAAMAVAPTAVAVEENVEDECIVVEDESPTQRCIEVIDTTSGNQVVTVIEMLSYSNKSGIGWSQYRRKQQDLQEAGVSLVEIDFIRPGHWTIAAPLVGPLKKRNMLYHVCVTRGWEPGRHRVYPCSMRRPLPTIKIPLRQTDAEVSIALQPLLDRSYRNGRYDDINYKQNPSPPLRADDALWIHELLTTAGLRP